MLLIFDEKWNLHPILIFEGKQLIWTSPVSIGKKIGDLDYPNWTQLWWY